jgi:glycosyltransferase involved in cell wall biosynthesis
MRIALLSRAVFGLHGYGGMERHVLELARHLRRSGVHVSIVTMPPTRPVEWGEPGIELHVVEFPRLPLSGIPDRVVNYPRWSQAAGEMVASMPVDLVHAQGLGGWGYSQLLAQRKARAPLVINPQGMEEFKTSAAKRAAYAPLHLLARKAAQQATALIAADTPTVGDIPRFLRVSPDKVYLIPNGIDVSAARNWVSVDIQRVLIQRLGLGHRLPLLLSVGRLEENKGFDVLVDALARIRSTLPSKWLWVLVGDGPQHEALAEKIRKLKLREHVMMLGSIDDATLHNLYEMATLFVHPTLFEGSSLVTLEAMAHGRPIVATTVGGIPDKVYRGYNGYLVPPGDVQALADKLLMALREPQRLVTQGQTSFQIARERFDWPVVIQQTVALYSHVTNMPVVQPQPADISRDVPAVT